MSLEEVQNIYKALIELSVDIPSTHWVSEDFILWGQKEQLISDSETKYLLHFNKKFKHNMNRWFAESI